MRRRTPPVSEARPPAAPAPAGRRRQAAAPRRPTRRSSPARHGRAMPHFARVIRDAYVEILEREADPGGLTSYNGQMNGGMSEAAMREALLRSPEFTSRNPDPGLSARLGLNVHIPSDPIIDDVTRG